MKKVLFIGSIFFFMTSCESEDKCHCEIFENIGTIEAPNYRYIGSLDGNCSEHILEEDLIYDSVNCN